MEYKDESGQVMYGYSQKNLDSLAKLLFTFIYFLILIFIVLTGIVVYLLFMAHKYHIVTSVVNALRG